MLIDGEGNEIFDLAKLEPWLYKVSDGKRESPITRISYGYDYITIEWRR